MAPAVFPANVVVGPSLSVNLYSLDLNQRTSYAIQMSSSIQHQIGKNGVIEIGYLGTLGLKLQQNVQVSNALPGSTAVAGRRPYVAPFSPQARCFLRTSMCRGTAWAAGPSRFCRTPHNRIITRCTYAESGAFRMDFLS